MSVHWKPAKKTAQKNANIPAPPAGFRWGPGWALVKIVERAPRPLTFKPFAALA